MGINTITIHDKLNEIKVISFLDEMWAASDELMKKDYLWNFFFGFQNSL